MTEVRSLSIESFRLTLLCTVLLICSCAQVAGPPGGEPDKTPPTMISSQPANGSVNVPSGNKVLIRFSEPVQPGAGRQVYISPRPAKEPKLKWKSDVLEVILPDTFKANQTYIVQVSSAVSDLRNNRLDSAVIVAFSTGNTLDSGHVAGTVTLAGAPQPSVSVGLYEVAGALDSLRYDSISPDYMTLTTNKGLFEFRYLPRKVYQPIAWTDRNRDEKFNPKIETYAVSDRPIDLSQHLEYTDLLLGQQMVDTATTQILSAAYSVNRIVRLRLTRPIRLDQIVRDSSRISLWPASDSTKIMHPLGLVEAGDSISANLSLDFPPLDDTAYFVTVRYDSIRPEMKSPRMVVKTVTDNEKPTVVKFSPGLKPIFLEDAQIQMVFSEPLQSSLIDSSTFQLKTSTGQELPIERRWRDPFHLNFSSSKLAAGKQYSFTVAESSLVDLSGNRLGDSVTTYKFSTINPDSLGTISGTIKVDLLDQAKDPVVMTFKEISGRFALTREFDLKEFKVDVPAGKYLLTGFLDSNHNGSRDLGSVWPMRYAETSAALKDTIAVRARFETAEVEFDFK